MHLRVTILAGNALIRDLIVAFTRIIRTGLNNFQKERTRQERKLETKPNLLFLYILALSRTVSATIGMG